MTSPVTEYPLWVGGVQVTEENASNIDGNNKASYDASTNTLTLNGYESNTQHEWTFDGNTNTYSAIIYSEHDLAINIVGNNTLTNNTKTDESRGIYTKGNLTITGEGSITVVSEDKNTNLSGIGINATKDVIISSGTVSSTGSSGIIADENVMINGNSVVTTISSFSYSILAAGGVVTISDDSNVTTTGDIGSYLGGVTISGGTVSVNGNDYGIAAYNTDDGVVTISGGEVTATGNTMAILGTIKNTIPGTGWTNADGTEGKAAIDVSTEGQDLSDYKKVQFPAAKDPATVTTAPTAKTLTYNGSAQELVSAGIASGGTMQYVVTTENTAPADNLYTTSIPTATDAGTYYVWYKAVGDDNHYDTDAAVVPVSIGELFSDVTNNRKYYYKPVYWAANLGITKGYVVSGTEERIFGVGLNCTREDMITFLWRAAGKPAVSSETSAFADVESGKYYTKSILWAEQNGIAKGYTTGKKAGTFGVGENCLREQIITFLYRLDKLSQERE